MSLTTGELFEAALRKCGGIVAEGETPSAELLQDTMEAFNLMIDAWSIERLMVYSTQKQSFTWPAATASRTLGATGDLSGIRPARLLSSSYFTYSSLDYPLSLVNEVQYNSLSSKSTSGSYPKYLFNNPTVPDCTLYLYPVPSAAITLYVISAQEMTEATDLTTDLVVPPGYTRALVYNLALEIIDNLGIIPSGNISRLAMTSKRSIKTTNAPMDILSIPAIINGSKSYDINAG